MKYQFIENNRSAFAVEKMCRVLKVTTSGYYGQKKGGISKRAQANEQLDRAIRAAHKQSRGNYGSPRITKELKEQGISCSENRVARRMQKNGIAAKTKRRFKVTTQSKHKHPVAENVLKQNFGATAQNQVWVSDITYVWTREGWLYLAIVLDLFSRQIVGWAMSHCLGQEIVLQALRQALLRRGPVPGLIFHSDQGVQYACQAFRELLTQHRIVQTFLLQ
jgi:putative transposase